MSPSNSCPYEDKECPKINQIQKEIHHIRQLLYIIIAGLMGVGTLVIA